MRSTLSTTFHQCASLALALLLSLTAGAISARGRGDDPLRPFGEGLAPVMQPASSTVYLPIISMQPAPPETPANLLANGDFERGDLSGWEADAGASISSTHIHSGAWAACLDNTLLRSTWRAVQPGVAYKLTAWVKIVEDTSAGGSQWGGFILRVNGLDWQTLAQSDALLAATHGRTWFKTALTFTATTSQASVDVGYFGDSGRRMLVCVDDIALFRKADNLPPRIEANLSPTTLTGLPMPQHFNLTGDDPDGAIVRVLWDFGDGGRALTWTGERRAGLPGVYTATVTVADDEGAITTQHVPWQATGAGWPVIVITAPAANVTSVATATLQLAGGASAGVTEVRVSTDRDVAVTAVGTTNWRAVIPLRPGANRILVQARDARGRIVTAERSVRYLPPAALRFADVTAPATGARWEPLTITFALENSAAAHPHLPYDPTPPPGLEWVAGVTVEANFTPDNWATVYTRPAFLHQPYERALKDGREWLYPQGDPRWTVRFAPPAAGNWQFRLTAQEAKGSAASGVYSFTVSAPVNPENHGPITVATQDSRYFAFADGTPFLGAGHGIGFDADAFSYAATARFDAIGAGNQNFFRWWLGGALWGSAWQPWRSRTLDGDGYLPATGLTLDRAYANGLASLRLDSANPILFYGFDSGMPGLVPGRTYRLRVRWRTEGIDAAVDPTQPYGVALKFTDWPEVGDTARFPALIAPVHGDTPWHIAEADFVANADFPTQYLTLVLENVADGAAYVDMVALYTVEEGGATGAQLLRNPQANSHLTYDDRRAAGIDAILSEANQRGLYFKLVISEKNEWLLNRLGPEGLPDPLGGHFDAAAGTAGRWLHAAYWRYLSARYGAMRAVHSWELVNEAAPGFGEHFRLAAALATQAAADGNPHLASTSTWATLAEDAWLHPESAPISYVDFHAYVNNTGWLEPKVELTNDSARLFAAYDRAALAAGFGKPVVWGELGIDGMQTTDEEEPRLAEDTDGVWLHKLMWARLGPGGVYPLYWYTENIDALALHPIFGAWRRFMAGIPLANGRYVDAAATTSTADLRVLGQKDSTGGQAHLWLDNARHTWRNVVNGAVIPVVSGVITVNMGAPNAVFRATWHDTRTGLPGATQNVTADADGNVHLRVTALATDQAVKLTHSTAR